MKNVNQVLHLLSQYNIVNSIDLEDIQKYCDKKLKTKIEVAYNPTSKQTLTFDKFRIWFEKGFGQNDIVVTKHLESNLVGAISSATLDYVTIECYIEDGEIKRNKIIFPMTTVKAPTNETKQQFRQQLYSCVESGDTNPIYSNKAEIIKPPKNKLIKFKNIKTNESGLGAFKKVDSSQHIVLHWGWFNNSALKLNEYDLGDIGDTIWEPITSKETQTVQSILAGVKKTWNVYLSRIEPLKLTANTGKTYW